MKVERKREGSYYFRIHPDDAFTQEHLSQVVTQYKSPDSQPQFSSSKLADPDFTFESTHPQG